MWSSIKWLLGRASDAERAWRDATRQPTFYRFYAVDPATLKVELLVDDSAYPPRNRLK